MARKNKKPTLHRGYIGPVADLLWVSELNIKIKAPGTIQGEELDALLKNYPSLEKYWPELLKEEEE